MSIKTDQLLSRSGRGQFDGGEPDSYCSKCGRIICHCKKQLKTAKKIVVAVELQCPECGAEIPSPGGSLYWAVNEIGSEGAYCFCRHCKQQLKFPKGL